MFKLSDKTDYYITDSKYPAEKAKDASSASMYDGTPIKADMFNQVFGFFQAAIKEAWGTLSGHLSGSPDDADDSDVLDAILEIVRQKVATHAALTGTSAHGASASATGGSIACRKSSGALAVATPSDAEDATTKAFVEQIMSRYRFRSVAVATTANITLSGLQTIDGVSLAAGDYVLVKDQTDATENGVYICQSGAWTLAWTAAADYQDNLVCVSGGSVGADKVFMQTTQNVVVGTSSVAFLELPLSLDDDCKSVARHKIDACPDDRPPIGMPLPWFGDLPDWAIDFGNGASTKYLWSDCPKLNTTQFKDILSKFVASGLCSNYDDTGFYVPDIKGSHIKTVGTNGKGYGHDAITTVGGVKAESLPNIVGWANMQMNYYSANYNNQGGAFEVQSTITAVYPTSTSSAFSGGSNLNFMASEWSSVYGGSHVTPLSVGCVWIVRYE